MWSQARAKDARCLLAPNSVTAFEPSQRQCNLDKANHKGLMVEGYLLAALLATGEISLLLLTEDLGGASQGLPQEVCLSES